MVLRDAKLVDGDHRVPAGHRAVDRVEQSLDAHGGVREVDEKEAGTIIRTRHHDADRRALRTGNEGLAAVDDPVVAIAAAAGLRSEERRVGKEGVSTCRSRWSTYHNKNKYPFNCQCEHNT